MNLNRFACEVAKHMGEDVGDVKKFMRAIAQRLYAQDFENMRDTFNRLMRAAAIKPKKPTRR